MHGSIKDTNNIHPLILREGESSHDALQVVVNPKLASRGEQADAGESEYSSRVAVSSPSLVYLV